MSLCPNIPFFIRTLSIFSWDPPDDLILTGQHLHRNCFQKRSHPQVLRIRGLDQMNFGEANGNPLQYSCLENPHGQRSLAGYSLWGHKDSTQLSDWMNIWILGDTIQPIILRKGGEEFIYIPVYLQFPMFFIPSHRSSFHLVSFPFSLKIFL